MLKPLVLATALTLGSAALAAAAPIPPTPDLLAGPAIVRPIRHVRDRAPLSPARLHRAYAIVLAALARLAGLIGAAVATHRSGARIPGFLTLTDADDGTLFRVRVLNTGEERSAHDHRFPLPG